MEIVWRNICSQFLQILWNKIYFLTYKMLLILTLYSVCLPSKQGWEFAHRLFAHFAQIKWATVSVSLRSLKTNEQPWANRSRRSEEMSDREQIAQVA